MICLNFSLRARLDSELRQRLTDRAGNRPPLGCPASPPKTSLIASPPTARWSRRTGSQGGQWGSASTSRALVTLALSWLLGAALAPLDKIARVALGIARGNSVRAPGP